MTASHELDRKEAFDGDIYQVDLEPNIIYNEVDSISET